MTVCLRQIFKKRSHSPDRLSRLPLYFGDDPIDFGNGVVEKFL